MKIGDNEFNEKVRIQTKLTEIAKRRGLLIGIERCQGLIANHGNTDLKGTPKKLIQDVVDYLISEYGEDEYEEHVMEIQALEER